MQVKVVKRYEDKKCLIEFVVQVFVGTEVTTFFKTDFIMALKIVNIP